MEIEKFEKYRLNASKILFPSSNKEIKECTSWLENIRKQSNSIDFFIQLFYHNLTIGELILSSQQLLWITKHFNKNDSDIIMKYLNEVILLLQLENINQTIKLNLYLCITSLLIKIKQQQQQQQSHNNKNTNLLHILSFNNTLTSDDIIEILLRIPELVLSLELYQGEDKDSINQSIISLSLSIFQEFPIILQFLDSNISMNLIFDSNSLTPQPFLSKILTIISEWLNISITLSSEYNSFISFYDANTFLSSRYIIILHESLKYLSQQDIVLTQQQKELFHSISELLLNLLKLKWSNENDEHLVISTVLQQFSILLSIISQPYTNLTSTITTNDSCLLSNIVDTLNNLIENISDCVLTSTISIMTSDSVIQSYQHSLKNNHLQLSPWSLYFQQLIESTHIFYQLTQITLSFLQSNQLDYHNIYYSIRILYLNICSDMVSFWDQIFQFNKSNNVSEEMLLSQDSYHNIILDIVTGMCLVEDPRFILMKFCQFHFQTTEDLSLWSLDHSENLLHYRKLSREFFRNFVIQSSSSNSGTNTNTSISFSFIEWIVDQIIQTLDTILNSHHSVEDMFLSLITESLLHTLSSLTSGDTLKKIFELTQQNPHWNSIIEKFRILMNLLFDHSKKYSPLLSLSPAHFRYIYRMGVLLIADMSPIVLFSLNYSFHLIKCCNFYLLNSLSLSETIEYSTVSSSELSTLSTSISFRTKQDHIGIVSLLKFIKYLKQCVLNSTISCFEELSSLLEISSFAINPLLSSSSSSYNQSVHIVSDFNFGTVLLYHYLNILSSFNQIPLVTWKSYLILVETCVEFSSISQMMTIQNHSLTIHSFHFILPSLLIGVKSIFQSQSISADNSNFNQIISNLLQLSSFDSNFPSFNSFQNSSIYLKEEYFFDLFSSILKNLQQTIMNYNDSHSMIVFISLRDLMIIIQTCFLPLCDLIFSFNQISSIYVGGIIKLLTNCFFHSPKLLSSSSSSSSSFVDDELKQNIKNCLNETLTRIIHIQIEEENEELLCEWLQSLSDAQSCFISWNDILPESSHLIEQLYSFILQKLEYSLQNLNSIQFFIILLEFLSKYLKFNQMKSQFYDILPIIHFLNYKIEIIIKLNIKHKQLNKLFISFIHFYSNLLFYFEIIQFSNENNPINCKQLQVFQSDYLFSAGVLNTVLCSNNSCGDQKIVNQFLQHNLLFESLKLFFYLLKNLNHYFLNFSNELLFNLFIRFFLFFGLNSLSSILRNIFEEFEIVELENHLLKHAQNGNWKKFKNCLKSLIK